MKRKLLDVAVEVCGYTKGKLREFETWWWNKDVNVAACRKREVFRIWKQTRNEEDKEEYCAAKRYLESSIYRYGLESLEGGGEG